MPVPHRLGLVIVIVILPVLLHVRGCFGGGNGPSLDVTRFFTLESNSTCGGDPPTSFESRSGESFNCSLGEHDSSFAVDGDPTTWWQSQNGDDPIALTFSLAEARTSLSLVSINLYVAHFPPQVITLEVRTRGASEYSLIQAYVMNDQTGACGEFGDRGVLCSNYSIGAPDINGNTIITGLSCPSDMSLPIDELRLTMSGFLPELSPEGQYHTLAEIEIFATIARGYFARSLHSIITEGENGRRMDSGAQVELGGSAVSFPGFSSRGYALLNFSSSERVMVQWIFPALPKTTNYQFFIRYRNLGSSRRLVGVVSQSGTVMNTRVTFIRDNDCTHPCYAHLQNAATPQIPQSANFSLNDQDPVTITFTLSSTNILLDAIIALPEEFYDPSNVSSIDYMRFSQECSTSNGELRAVDSLSTDFCTESAIQLSLDFFCATPACACQSPGSVDQDCDVYGGQCTCVEPQAELGFSAVLGRQCQLCPFYSYLTPDGCTPCTCPNEMDNCDLMTGQCSNCPPLVEGRSCDTCVANSFGDPTVGCTPCDCNDVGTQSCNMTTGECNCRTGVSGATCDGCMEGWFNFTTSGCVNCDCDSVGSEGINCSMSGLCTCKPGVVGTKCTNCDNGFFAFSSTGCLSCNCSSRTIDCQLSPNSSVAEPVELCQCPFPYVGDSCELCTDGYYLSFETDSCEPCQCNGKSDMCEDGTGDCIGCVDNTTGVDCGECLDGFYDVVFGDGLEFVCQPCPCTTTTALNTSCQVDVSGSPECFCRPGHETPLCDSCLHGYFGSPPALRCRSCDCNGNIDPDVPGSCDRETGLCLMCINNSTGPECELCANGYYGDATLQDCQPCECDVGGSVDVGCNSTGHCNCLDGVGGMRCDTCLPGYWNFSAGLGCFPCMCAGGSVSSECDVLSGVCLCNQGVGGDDCSTCLDGYFNFTNDGCTSCECGLGAVNPTCTAEGRCFCQPGVIGDKCDQCEPYHTNLSPSGCQLCSQCELSLRNNLTLSENEQNVLMAQLTRLISLQQANASGHEEVDMLIQLLQDNVTATEQYLERIMSRLDSLSSTTTDFTIIVNTTNERVGVVRTRLVDLSPYAESVHEHIVEVSNKVQNIQIDTGSVFRFAEFVLQSVQDILLVARDVAANVSQVAAQHNGNYSMEVDEAMEAYNRAEVVNMNAQNALRMIEMLQDQSQYLANDYRSLNESYELLLMQAGDLSSRENDLEMRLFNLNVTIEQLRLNISVIEYTVMFATRALANIEEIIRQAEYALIMVMDDIRTLAMLVGQTDDAATMTGSGDGSALFSGSGLPDLQPTLPTPEPVSGTIVGEVELLRRAVVQLEQMYLECSGVIQQSVAHANNVSTLAMQIDSILTPSLTSGNRAVEAIIDYNASIAMIQAAFELIVEANQTVSRTLVDIDDLMTNNLTSMTEILLNTSMDLLSEAEELYDTIRELLPGVERAREEYSRAENLTQEIQDLAIMLAHDVNQLAIAVSTNRDIVSRTINMIEERLDRVEDIHEIAVATVSILQQNISSTELRLNETQMTLIEADTLLESANATAVDAWEAFTVRNETVNDIDALSRSNQMELEALNSSIDSLQQQLQRALQAAASIDLALRFYGNSSKSFSVPSEVNSAPYYSTTISMVFQPEDVSSGVMLAVRENQTNQGVALRIDSGSVHFEYHSDSSTYSVNVSGVREDQWYQLYASVETDVLALSVAPLQIEGSTTMEIRNFLSSLTPLSLSSEDVVLLGGTESIGDAGLAPTEGFSGCLDRVVINNAQLSLLLPNEMDQDFVTCSPRPPAELPRPLESGVWLQGSSSLVLTNVSAQLPMNTDTLELEFSFRTFSADGILLYLTDFSTTHYLLVYLSNGQLVLNTSLTGLDFNQLSTMQMYNDGEWYNTTVAMDGSSITLTIGSEVITMDASLASTFAPSGIVSIGSPIQATATSDGVTAQLAAALETVASGPLFSASGCLRSLQLNGIMIDISEDAFYQQMVSLSGCPVEVSDGVRFMGDGYALFDSPVGGDVNQLLNITFSFRGSQLAASLLNLPQLSISIYHTRLRIDAESTGLVLLSREANLNDNQWHMATLTFTPDANITMVELFIDGVSDSFVTQYSEAPMLVVGDPLVVGGTTNQLSVVVAESFRGCMRDIIINGRVLNFVEAVAVVNVALYGCRPPSLVIPIPPPPPPLPPPPSVRPETTIGLNGSDASFIALVVSEQDVLRGFSIVLEFQTASSEAVLLYLQGSVYADFIALQLRSGLLVFSYDLGSGRADIQSENTYDDGLIHTVELQRFEQCGVMIIDGGQETQTGNSPGMYTSLNINTGLLFLGNIPDFVNQVSLFEGSFERSPGLLACFHAFSINGVYESLGATDIRVGTGFEQCMPSYNNIAYFGADSFSRIFDNFYAGRRFTFSMDIRTNNCSGILLYVATPLYPDHVLLELANGRLRFVFDNGPGEEVIEYSPAGDPMGLCDGQWHSLTVEKDGETGYLTVDGGARLMVTSLFSNFLAINTNDPLYVGGVPESVRLRFTVQNSSFQGCINNFSLSQDRQEPQSIPLAQASESRNVEHYMCRL